MALESDYPTSHDGQHTTNLIKAPDFMRPQSHGKRITVDSALYILNAADGSKASGITLNKLARRKYASYRAAAAIVNRLVACKMLEECITKDHQQIPRIAYLITEKGRNVLQAFSEW